MSRFVVILAVTMTLLFAAGLCVADMPVFTNGDLIGMTPEMLQEVYRNQQRNDLIMLEQQRQQQMMEMQRQQILREQQRQEQEVELQRQLNPYKDCVYVTEIEGKDLDETVALVAKVGATHFQLIKVTPTSTTAKAFNCPKGSK